MAQTVRAAAPRPLVGTSIAVPATKTVTAQMLVSALLARVLDPDADLPIPPMAEALAPSAGVVRAQQLARELALRRGRDPDAPAGLRMVTAT